MRRFSEEDKETIWDMREAGVPVKRIAKHLGRQNCSIRKFISTTGGQRPSARERCPLRLSLAEREEISRGLAAGLSFRAIADRLGRSASTVCREVNANGGRAKYRGLPADRGAQRRALRPKRAKLARCRRLRSVVERKLEAQWSPQQISGWLAERYPNDPEMRVSHETIYQSLFVQSRGALRKELHACLRTGRALRVPRARSRARGKQFVSSELMISERPAEAADRAVPGHWEGDLILGLESSAIGTLVERTTRFTMLLHLPRMGGHGDQPRQKNGPALTGHGAEAVRDAITATITTLPEQLRRSLTWDQGTEMAQHAQLRIDTGLQVYFCDPQSPWQRGSNENTNGLLRQYFPRGTDLARHTANDLDAVAHALNSRPRKTLAWKTPAEALDELLSSTEQAGVATTA